MSVNIYAQQKKKLVASVAEKISDKELFGPLFSDYAQSLVSMLTPGEKYSVRVLNDPAIPVIGYTDGKGICVNAGSDMARYYKEQELRFNTVLGILFHECGHCNDPTLLKCFQTVLDQIENQVPFVNERDNFTEEEQEVYDLLSDPVATPMISEIIKTVLNIGLDAHDEAMMTRNFNSMVGYCLTIALAVQEAKTPRLDQLRNDKENSEFDIVSSLIFQFIRYGKFIMFDTDESWEDPAVKKISSISKQLDVLRTSDNPDEHKNAAFDVLVALWPLIKDQLDKQQQSGQNGQQSQSGQQGQNQNGQSGQNNQSGSSGQSGQNNQSGQGSGGSPLTAQGVSSIVSAVQKAAKGMTSQTPQNITGKTKLSAAPSQQGGNGQTGATQQGTTPGADDASNAMNQLVKQIASDKTDEKLENEQSKATSDDLAIIAQNNACTTHRGRFIRTVNPRLSTCPNNKAQYERIYKEVAPFVTRLVAEMRALFEELREGSISRGRTAGRVDLKGLRRISTDQRIFSSKKNPLDIPDMAICLLLDQSGSMSGRRIHSCEKAAILLEAFADQLEIPIMVCGHNTVVGGIHFYVHRDYDTIDKRRKYALADIETDGSNRDGYAIYAASELLGKRPEEDKLMIVISDGQPNDDGYGGEMAAEDIRNTVAKANRTYGIETIAAAIGDDKDRIKEIYKSGYLDISDLTKLPKALVKLIRERLEA